MKEKKSRYTEAQARASRKYFQKFATIQIRTEEERREQIRQHAEAAGESMNAYILRVLDEQIKREDKLK